MNLVEQISFLWTLNIKISLKVFCFKKKLFLEQNISHNSFLCPLIFPSDIVIGWDRSRRIGTGLDSSPASYMTTANLTASISLIYLASQETVLLDVAVKVRIRYV